MALLSTLAAIHSPAIRVKDSYEGFDELTPFWSGILYLTWMMWHKEWIRMWLSKATVQVPTS